MTYEETDVLQWIEDDPDEATRAELSAVLTAARAGDGAAAADLSDRFAGFLEFGTAGLRGEMGAGPARMNRAVVRKAAAGLTAYLGEHAGPDALVVVGYDARYGSEDYAKDTAAIVTAAGMRAMIMPRALPTPLLAYAVRALEADAGVMVTASHNPARDNGYKVYLGGRCADRWGRGVQLIPPADSEIAAAIAATGPARDIPLAEGYEVIDEELINSYIEHCVGLAGKNTDLSIVYTAMHGVGAEVMRRIFAQAGFTDVTEVAEQCEPDPDFPTVAFPNPEEAGALDLAIRTAQRVGADIIIASDPDADRCSAAIASGGTWRQLSGDEIGALLGERLARRVAEGAGWGEEDEPARPVFANSIVSSRLLSKIAASHGIGHAETLTGFKWIARVPELAYGYEEAIGFCVNPEVVRDKDGLSTAILLASLAADLKREGEDLIGELRRLYRRHGVHLTAPVTVRVEDLRIIPATMAKLRAQPPRRLAGSDVVRVEDLSEGSDDLPPTDALAWYTHDDARVIVRPSGTEPKVKCYLEVRQPLDGDLDEAIEAARRRLDELSRDVAQALRLD
ncbi:MAG: phospho-sugar mutase [Actinomycetaceae bacterium]|nr:phospho-sugar mutase [Actinomycetaceae bacterium]